MLARLKMDKVDYIKMDIEGAEREALKGAAKTIAQFRPRLFLDANHLADDHQVLPPLIRNLNAKYQLATGGCEYNVNNGGVYTPHTNYYF
jgi:hypothetical protein